MYENLHPAGVPDTSVRRPRQEALPIRILSFTSSDVLSVQEGAILELLQHEPEKQLEALGKVLSSPYGRNQPRVVEVMQNLATVPAFFSLVNG